MAMFGWEDSKQATAYTRAAEKKLAAAGTGLLVPGTRGEQKV